MERLLSAWPTLKCILYCSMILSIVLFVSGVTCGIITRVYFGFYGAYGGGLWAGFWAFVASLIGLQALKFDHKDDFDGRTRVRLINAYYIFVLGSFACHVILVYLASNDYYYYRAFHLLHGDQMALVAGMLSMGIMVEALLQSKGTITVEVGRYTGFSF